MKRRVALSLIGSAPFGAVVSQSVRAQAAYPDRVVKIVVPFGPGGSTDIISRLVGKQLETVTGKPFVIENKPGATGMIGTTQVKNAPADGYTLLLGSTSTLPRSGCGSPSILAAPISESERPRGMARLIGASGSARK